MSSARQKTEAHRLRRENMAFLGENAGLSSRERGLLEEVYLRPSLQRVKALSRNTSDLELM